MKTLTVALGERSYPIFIGPGVLRMPEQWRSCIRGADAFVVTNERVAPLYLKPLVATLSGAGFRVGQLVLPDGETHKNLDTLNRIFDTLLEERCSRQVTLVALGGGVIGDMTGFAAATYQRGVDFIQVPTTLLAQVDSSVGGKTAVNHRLGKNMIGAFYQPRCVLADTGVLDTLPAREFAAGLAEVVKYGLIADPDFFAWLEASMEALVGREPDALTEAIERSCANKARIVSEDERETGRRAILNLGHTFGHAIEAAQGYRDWLHGEAVAAGMVMAATLSARLGWLAPADVERVRVVLQRAGLPVAPPALPVSEWHRFMAVDKKVVAGRLRLVLLRQLGEAVVTAEVPADALDAVLAEAGG